MPSRRQTNRSSFHSTSMLVGFSIGMALALWQTSQLRRHPERAFDQRLVNRAMDRELRRARDEGPIPLGERHRYVVFSDHHKGARNQADDFRQCEHTYLSALDHYYANDFTLVVLGDAEELWEERIARVMHHYANVFASERRFYPERYVRVVGNHDDAWALPDLVDQYLHPIFPGLQVRRSLLLGFQGDNGGQGELFLLHGHQGMLYTELFEFLPPHLMPIYRDFQILTGWGRTTPARDACLRSHHDTHMYRWASRQDNLILVAGHTHRPVWSSMTHLERLVLQLNTLDETHPRPRGYAQKVRKLQEEIKSRTESSPPCPDTIKTRPCYFNTGCCRFADGDITGLELEDGELRLIKWGDGPGGVVRHELESAPLANIFSLL